MIKRLPLALCIAAMMLLSACGPMARAFNAAAGPTPAPLAGTSIDNQGIAFAFEAADAIREFVGELRQAGHRCCIPGTPNARAVAGHLRSLADLLRGASSAQRLGDAGSATAKLVEAQRLVSAIRDLLPDRGGTAGLRLESVINRRLASLTDGGSIARLR